MLDRIRRALTPRVTRQDKIDRLVQDGLTVGENFHMGVGCMIDKSHLWHISIGDNVTFAPGVHVLAHDASMRRYLQHTRIGMVSIGEGVFVGAGSVILPGVTIGKNAIIGAGSVVSRDIPAGRVAAGNPARVICTLDAFLAKRQAELESVPRFGEEFTVRQAATREQKEEMNQAMAGGIGYVV